jgi:hypothetical protein
VAPVFRLNVAGFTATDVTLFVTATVILALAVLVGSAALVITRRWSPGVYGAV